MGVGNLLLPYGFFRHDAATLFRLFMAVHVCGRLCLQQDARFHHSSQLHSYCEGCTALLCLLLSFVSDGFNCALKTNHPTPQVRHWLLSWSHWV